ncbi:MAG: SusD/RagB family nutrient-binding outer membrane lipoprotein [Flavobacteriaceae bacterium]|nr:SusD/RagB family nutrient-binding outer membrane lipoprotein [Flavobacteriaceae bacterium]
MKKIIFLTVFALAILVNSCTDFDVSNENPDVASNIDLHPEILLTNLENNAVNELVGDAWSEGNLMGQYGARIVFTEFDLFEWGSQSGLWNNLYLAISDAKALEKIANEKGFDNYAGVSKVMQAWLFSILTDMYGDVPFIEVNQATEENYTPFYDTQEDIYNGLLDMLAEANTLLDGANNVDGDLYFGGDVTVWRKFANSLRLRLALRLSEVNPSKAASVIKTIYDAPIANPYIMSNADNASITFSTSSPFAHPVTEESGYRVGSYNEYRIAEHFVGILKNFNDPRLEFIADPTANSVVNGTLEVQGMQNGIVDGPAYEYKGGDSFLSKFNIGYFYLTPNSNQARFIIHSEVMFILAEAAQRNWISADAQTLYNEGVASNFAYWGVNMPANYLSTTGVAYDGELETIINQKYIALFYTDFQGFIEFRRTGFPNTIEPGPDAFYDIYPSRFEYPGNEAVLNKENYNTAVARMSGGDKITSKVWWEN